MKLRSCIAVVVLLVFFPSFAASQQPKAKAKQPALPEGVRVERDLEYARRGETSLGLDLYLPTKSGEKPLPVVVWIHGGGWIKGSKDKCPAAYLAAQGFAVASVDYRLATVAMWPAQIDDCRDAIRWLRGHATEHGLDGDHIGVWGSSAGGHLVALLGTLPVPTDREPSCRVQAVCDWFGPADLLTMPPNVLSEGRTEEDLAKSNGAMLLGGTVRDRPELAKQASALYQVGGDDPPFLIMHGDHDPGVPLDQSERLHSALQAAGVNSTLDVIEGGVHGGPLFQTDEIKQTVANFFAEHLKK